MALKSTVFRATLQVADLNRHHYGDHAVTLARHPSETDERMMVRLLAFALYADEALTFANGLCVEEEPDLWQRDLSGQITRWIEVGQPDEKWLRKACGRAEEVVVLCYGRTAPVWWRGICNKLDRQKRLRIAALPVEASAELAKLAARTMHLQYTIQDDGIWVAAGDKVVTFELEWLMNAPSG